MSKHITELLHTTDKCAQLGALYFLATPMVIGGQVIITIPDAIIEAIELTVDEEIQIELRGSL